MAFAEVTDVETRLGRTLSQPEADMVAQVIADVTGLIASEVDKDEAWAAALDPVPVYFKELCIVKSIRAGTNVDGLRAESEQLGSYQRSRTWTIESGEYATGGVFLTDGESRMCRRVVYGSNMATATLPSLLDELPEWADLTPFLLPYADGDQDYTPAIEY